jgi:hypothetical protein
VLSVRAELPGAWRSRGARHDHQMVQRCDGQQSKISMQDSRVKISGSKIDNSGNRGNRGRNRGLTRAGRRRKVVDVVDARHARRAHCRRLRVFAEHLVPGEASWPRCLCCESISVPPVEAGSLFVRAPNADRPVVAVTVQPCRVAAASPAAWSDRPARADGGQPTWRSVWRCPGC